MGCQLDGVPSLAHYFTWLFKGRLLYNHRTNNFYNLENQKIYIDKELENIAVKGEIACFQKSGAMAGFKCLLCEVMG